MHFIFYLSFNHYEGDSTPRYVELGGDKIQRKGIELRKHQKEIKWNECKKEKHRGKSFEAKKMCVCVCVCVCVYFLIARTQFFIPKCKSHIDILVSFSYSLPIFSMNVNWICKPHVNMECFPDKNITYFGLYKSLETDSKLDPDADILTFGS